MKLLSVIFLLVFATLTYADDGIGDLKLGCKDPGAFHNQLPPSDIKITCGDTRVEWVPAGPDEATIHNKRTVCSNATTSKPNVHAVSVCEPCNWPGSDYQCGGFKEVEKKVEMEFSVTCDQVLAMESVNKFCQGAVLSETIHNEKILEARETGRVKKVCGVQNYLNDKPMSQDWTPMSIRK